MDTLMLKECRFECALGVTDAERSAHQPVGMDIEMAVDAARAGASDDIADTVDYLAVFETVRKLIESKPFNLVESMGEEVSALILDSFPVSAVTLTIRKTRPMEGKAAWAGITMTRSRR